MNKKILLIGGTGVVGCATALVAIDHDFDVYTISLEKNAELPNSVHQYVCDRNDRVAFRSLMRELHDRVGIWDIVFDIIGSKQRDAEQTYLLLRQKTRRIVFLSTTLVYSRTTNIQDPLKSSTPLARKGEMGGYVDSKVAMEEFIHSRNDFAWTILRPYHILGRYSLLGCLPDHNRDPHLVEKIKKGKSICLCCDGNVPLQIIHPKDIAMTVMKVARKDGTIHRAYNVVNPQIVTAREYYEEIARQLDCDLIVKSKSFDEVWDEQNGWELTTFPHVYDMSDLKKDIQFTPSIGLREAIFDALHSPQKKYETTTDIPVHNRMTLLPRPKRIDWLFNK